MSKEYQVYGEVQEFRGGTMIPTRDEYKLCLVMSLIGEGRFAYTTSKYELEVLMRCRT
jgi:hypothetical protein